MKAVGYYLSLPITDAQALVDIESPIPQATEHDLLVAVKAISVNPVDVKVRTKQTPNAGEANVLGWDAAGIVKSVGPAVTLFKAGDPVWYAGSINRPGSNSEYQLVDERIVGHMPKTLDFAEAAALPLTAITAWELLFDRLAVAARQPGQPLSGQTLLVIGAAGGVGSILVQLALKLTSLTIIATASRPESKAWLRQLGVHHVIDHSQPFLGQLAELGIHEVDYVISLNKTEQHLAQIAEAIKPQGKFALIDDPGQIDIGLFKRKSVSIHWEFMFTRPLYQTHDQIKQHELLNQVAKLVDQGLVKSTVNHRLGKINAAYLKKAHALLESNRVIGKITLEGF